MKHFYAYILKCNDGSYYTGHTDDLEKRISEHNMGEIDSFTAKRLPLELVFVQEFARRDEAIEAEQKIKGWSRKKKEALMEENWPKIKILAMRYTRNKKN